MEFGQKFARRSWVVHSCLRSEKALDRNFTRQVAQAKLGLRVRSICT